MPDDEVQEDHELPHIGEATAETNWAGGSTSPQHPWLQATQNDSPEALQLSKGHCFGYFGAPAMDLYSNSRILEISLISRGRIRKVIEPEGSTFEG